MAIDASLAEEYDGKLDDDLKPEGRLGLPHRYLEGRHDEPYMPRGAKAEYRHLSKRAITNWLPLVPMEYSQGLAVDGYRSATSDDNEAVWRRWQENGLDARQTIAHNGALSYGTSYTLVLPAKGKRALVRPLSPLRSAAWYADDDDDFPEVAIRRLGRTADGKGRLLEVYKGPEVATFSRDDGDGYKLVKRETHSLGVVPFVRFRDRVDGQAVGVVRPLKGHQDRINEVVFNILIGMQYASFRQRWATGLVIPEDEETGEPIDTFDAAVNRLWISDSPDAKFGDFAQTQLTDHQAEYKAAVSTMAAAAQLDADLFAGNMTNVTGEALHARRFKTTRRIANYQLLFGESWEQVLRLAAKAAGDDEPDVAAEIRWRDTTGEEMASKVAGLAQLHGELNVPAEALWDDVPGVTDTKLQRWRELAKSDPLDDIAAELKRQAGMPTAPAPAADAGALAVA